MSVAAAVARVEELRAMIAARPPAPAPGFDGHLRATASQAVGSVPAAAAAGGPAAPYDELISAAAARHGVDPALLKGLIRQESGFDPSAGSPAGARGLAQLMPGTAAALGVTDPLDPAQSVDGGARYLRQQLDRFGDVSLALAAYNAGPGAVERHGGVPPYPETREYVQRVLHNAAAYRTP